MSEQGTAQSGRLSATFRRAIRSDRTAAVLLLGAAVLGLALTNSLAGPGVLKASGAMIGPLSTSHWISDLLLAVFFFIVATELKFELSHGQLNSVRKALVPAIAALGGVAFPALIFLALTSGAELAAGWPIPTATDIAFALGVLAIFGHGLPTRLRVFILALAVLDDLVGIMIIATIFTDDVDLAALLGGGACVAGVAVASRMRHRAPRALTGAMALLAIVAWWLVHESGVHPTIAGVAVGLAITVRQGGAIAHRLHPWSNTVILPLFAFSAALVVLPQPGTTGPVLTALAIALPVGKTVGITVGAVIAAAISRRHIEHPVLGWDLVALAVIGGIGFTVSLLMNQLAFEAMPAERDQGVLGVLIGSTSSLVLGAILVSWRARVYRRNVGAGVP